MLDVTFSRDSRNRLSSVFADGHAEWAEQGEDIVCAAVSAVLQAARLGLEEHVRATVTATQDAGVFRMRWPEETRDDARIVAIVATAELAVAQIARQYPSHVAFHRAHEA